MTATVCADGLRLAADRLVPWSDVYHVEWTRDAGVVASVAGLLTVDRASAAAIEARIAPWEGQRTAPEPATRGVWRQRWSGRAQAGLLGLVALGLGALALPDALGLLVVAGLFAGWVWGLAWQRLGPTVRLDEDGIHVGRRRIPWAELRAVDSRGVPLSSSARERELLLRTVGGWVRVKTGYVDGESLTAALRAAAADCTPTAPATPRGWYAPSKRGPTAGGVWLDDQRVVWLSRQGVQVEPRPTGAIEPRVAWKLADYVGVEPLQRALDGEPAVDTGTHELTSEAFEECLGVAPGGALRCGVSPLKLLSGWLLWALTAYGAAWYDRLDLAVGPLVMAAVWLLDGSLGGRQVVADGQGLTVGRGRRRWSCAWSEVQAVEPDGGGLVVRTSRGVVRLTQFAPRQAKIAAALAAVGRDSGLTLPSDLPAPAQALSRLAGPADEGERGLSLSEREES